MNIPADSEILELIKNSKKPEEGFRILVEKYRERTYWLIRRLLIDHDDTDDVLQEVFIKIWKNIGNFKGKSQLFTWIYRIATNEALSFMNEKCRRLRAFSGDKNHFPHHTAENEAFFNGDRNAIRFREALLTLPDRQRLVFNLKYFEEMKYEEIAEITGVTVGALKASYHHAVQKIKKELTEIKPFVPGNIKQENEQPGKHKG